MVADTECALSGIMATDFSRILTGPLATMLPMRPRARCWLSQLGAASPITRCRPLDECLTPPAVNGKALFLRFVRPGLTRPVSKTGRAVTSGLGTEP